MTSAVDGGFGARSGEVRLIGLVGKRHSGA